MMRKYTETIDLNTETGGPSVLGLHTPISGDAYRFLYPYFQAYKKYKYLGMDVTIVNAAHLPYDPEQIGKVEGTNYVDPRDSLNPVLFKGCHGESLGPILDSIYEGLSTFSFKDNTVDKEVMLAALENFYYTALGDNAWRKSPIQKTLHLKGLHPIVYNLGTNRQIAPTMNMAAEDYIENSTDADRSGVNPNAHQPGQTQSVVNGTNDAFTIGPNSIYDPTTGIWKYRVAQSMFTTGVRRLGWMDTLEIAGRESTTLQFEKAQISLLPKLFMGILILPKANLVRNYLRIVITHKFKFAGYRSITTGGAFPGFDMSADHYGYTNHITGNVSGAETKAILLDTSEENIVEDEDEPVDQ